MAQNLAVLHTFFIFVDNKIDVNMSRKITIGWMLCAALCCTSCRSQYELTDISVTRVPIDATWDAAQDAEVVALIAPYKSQFEGMMNEVLGQAAVSMDKRRPEDLLGNLIADVLREAGARVLQHPADVGLMNMGGIRNVLTEGNITVGNVFEILPFENALCVLQLRGSQLKKLFEQIASRGGEAISGARMVMTTGRELVSVEVDGKPIDDDKVYTLATIDYLAEGNDGLTAIREVVGSDYPENAVLRDVFMDYVKQCTARGEIINSQVEGRVTVLSVDPKK